MNTHLHYRLAGMGGTADTVVGVSTQLAQAAVAPVMTLTSIGPTVAAMLSLPLTVAIPVVGAVIAGISLGIEALLHSGCGQTCIVTSQWANQAAAQLQQNGAAYFAIPAPRPKSVQQIALANFQAIWNVLVQQCSQPGLGTAGKNCIADRQAGACKWKATTPPAYPGQPAQGACWNWWNAYRDPIADDPNVVDDTVSSAVSSVLPASVTTALSSAGISPTMLLVAAGALVLVMVAS